MGYGFYLVDYDRPAGYMVIATCDRRGCEAVIDRGLGCLCGDNPGLFNGEPGCGRYYCDEHLGWVGPRGGCPHPRGVVSWGRVLSDMEPNADGSVVCLDPIGHKGAHAWTRKENAA